ncbi:MAG: DegV family protein [Anaerolineae bacterium]|jgi:DegV family protein with EDD domain
MAGVRIVVDSAAELDNDVVQSLGIQVVPWAVQVGSEQLIDSPLLRTREFYERVFRSRQTLATTAPTTAQFTAVLERCAREGGSVVAVLSASTLTRSVDHARRARSAFLGRCDVQIVDSQFISCIQGELAVEAAKAAQLGMDAVEIVRLLNAMIAQSYWAFVVESPEVLLRNGLVENNAEYLGTPAGYKPLLLLEEGVVSPLPRSRRRGEPVERMVEFVGEFSHLRRLWTISAGVHTGAGALHDRLQEVLPEVPYTDHVYGPVVATCLGTTLLGVAAIESA